MALNSPFYMAAGDTIIEDGTGTTAYKVLWASFPEPDGDGFGGHLPAVRSVGLQVEGTSASDAASNLNALRRSCVRDEKFYFRHGSTGNVLECRIREASLIEEAYDPLRRDWSVQPYIGVTLTVTTDPYWLAPWSTETTVSTVTAVPGHFDISGVAGEVDALLSIRAVPTRNGKLLAIGIKPEPGSGYDYVDEYGAAADTSDANASGTYKIANTGTVDTSLSEHWPYLTGTTVGNIDTNDNRGRHLMLARIDSSATTAANCTVQGRVTTTGNAIASSVSVDETAVALASVDLWGVELGDIQIPAGQVPDIDTGSGYAAETAQVTQATDDGTLTITAAAVTGGYAPYCAELDQTFAAVSARITAIEYEIDAAPSVTPWNTSVYLTVNGTLCGTGTALSTVGVHKITLETPVDITAADSVSFGVTIWANASFTVGFAHGNARYASGALTTPAGSGEAAGDDLKFVVYGQTPLGFNTTNPVLAACTESTKTFNLDYVQRIPVDYAAVVYRLVASASLGTFYDADTDTPYVADADGIGPAIYDKCEVRKPLRVKPAVTNRVVIGIIQGDETVEGMGTLTYKTRARYLTATG